VTATRPRVVIVGGGMAGLATAWELTQGDWRQRLESVTVYQRGWRLGGKGASSRGPHGRIEEHGLHVLLGYYDATFRVLRQVYGELDRSRTDPECPIATWRDAVAPSGDVGLAEHADGSWGTFVTRFSVNDEVPGEPGAEDRPLAPLHVATRALRLLVDFQSSLQPAVASASVYLSTSPQPRPSAASVSTLLRGGGITALAGVLEVLERLSRLADEASMPVPAIDAVVAPLTQLVGAWRDGLRASVLADDSARRTWMLVDLAATNVLGMAADGLLTGGAYDRIDHLDYREWLARHGAAPETLASPIVRGMYDLVFAYEDGDKSRPRFAAGLGLQLAARMLFDFKGSIFWRMQAGMGEVVFAPLYEALVRRGVNVEFFHRADAITAATDGRSVDEIRLRRQASVIDDAAGYDPLIRVDGLPCWPDRPRADQLTHDPGAASEAHRADTETDTGSGTDSAPDADADSRVTLRAGDDFDVAVLAVSLGMVPHVAADLIEASPAWRAMTDNVATVATRAAQLWLDASGTEMGWAGPSDVTLSGFGDTFDTWADMTHLLPRESWPEQSAPRSLAYLCSALPEPTGPVASAVAREQVRQTLRGFLDDEAGALWPGAVDAEGFRWDLLWDDQHRHGPDRLDAQYVRANTDPSDRYVQSLPGSGRHRIEPGGTGFANLAIAGDWTACGLDAGCVEAATRSGGQAARAILAGSVRAVASSGETPARRDAAP
jgi:uncharacterized protein with NAD-binding domain and iron-sulfur cluster